MKIKKHLDQGFISLKFEFIPTLSIESQGVLTQMVNLPECDYVSLKKFHEMYPTSSMDSLKKIFSELENKKCILRTSDNHFAINKIMIFKTMRWIEPSVEKECVYASN